MDKKVKMLPIEDVIPYIRNVKQHPSTQVRKIASSIADYGWDQPIVVDKDMVIVKGHGRYLAAESLELKEVPVLINTEMTQEEAAASRIADNKTAESDWDAEVLLEELEFLKEQGIGYKEVGFSNHDMKRLYPDQFIEGTEKPVRKEYEDAGGGLADGAGDATVPQVESSVAPHTGDEAWLRRLSMVDYLNSHDNILVGFSGGKDSLCAMLWILENCERDKIKVFFSNLGWGVDWPCGIAYVSLIEKMYNIKVAIIGPTDPKSPARFYDMLLQYGYMNHASCWLRNRIKIPGVTYWLKQEGYHPMYGGNNVQVIAVRWAESTDRAKQYPDRGVLKDTGSHYASPVVEWTLADVVKFMDERGIRLHSAYQHSDRMGCIVCPHECREGAINNRKKFPKIYRQLLEFQARGARRRGNVEYTHMCKQLTSLADCPESSMDKFSGPFSAIALSPTEFEDYMEEKMGEKLPQRPYTTVPFDPRVHNFRSDLDSKYWSSHEASEEFSVCTLTG